MSDMAVHGTWRLGNGIERILCSSTAAMCHQMRKAAQERINSFVSPLAVTMGRDVRETEPAGILYCMGE
ncbi:hypothetical protein I7I53_03733 [Histoplasma capsulatum var. duboisii H88]|uniref:Uncharacterized protein n=1 Tax=Ajellomyces capsulatus (strain H88) TaxID=544711 RepID=A0A8A1LUY4_AJEC8|nr:hypothetical protein I7I53_03733 [Histoplasma capsulatum var. duboisii H88]